MEKIYSTRGMGKTTRLLSLANTTAKKNPDQTILFVTNYPRYLNDKIPQIAKNVKFISYKDFKTMNYKGIVIIDEVDLFLKELDVIGYSLTIGE